MLTGSFVSMASLISGDEGPTISLFLGGGGGWVIWYVHIFFSNPLIHADYFFLGFVLAGYFFLPQTFCVKIFCVDRLVKVASIINQIIKDL